VEIRRRGMSYAIDTVQELLRQYPEHKLFFIIGADTLKELYLWKRIVELLKLCEFVTFSRPGHAEAINPDEIGLEAPWPERLIKNMRPGRMIDISSSDIRHRMAEELSISYLVPQAVEMYISEHKLYTR
jgi:nicotinate-nucleotide adenylyltransferase